MTGYRLWQIAGWTMLHYLWVGALLGAAALVLRRQLRSASVTIRYAAALGSFLFLSVVPISVAFWVAKHTPAPESTMPERIAPAVAAIPPSVKTPSVRSDVGRPTSAAPDRSVAPARTAAPVAAAQSPSPPPVTPKSEDAWRAALARMVAHLPWLWVFGAPLTFLVTAVGLLGAERLRRASRRPLEEGRLAEMGRQLAATLRISRRVGLAVCDRIAAPILLGIVRPVILLPAVALTGWSPQQLEMVLLHELAHVRRYDNLVNLVQRVLESALFFQPMVWVISGWVRREREHCCDAVVVDRTGRPCDYAKMLVALADAFSASLGKSARRPSAFSQAILSFAERPLVARVRRILNKEEPSMRVSRRAFGMIVAGLLVSAALVGRYCWPGYANDAAAGADLFEFEGRVVDPDGSPLPAARVYFAYNCYNSDLTQKGPPQPLRATSGPDGRFSFTLKKSEFDGWHRDYPRGICNDVDYKNDCRLVAVADGFGAIWQPAFVFDRNGQFREVMRRTYPESIEDINRKQEPVLRVVKDDVPLMGRIVDPQGRPVAGATVRVVGIQPVKNEDLTDWLKIAERKGASYVETAVCLALSFSAEGYFPDSGISSRELPGPWTAVSDKDGNVHITGIGRERLAGLLIEGPGIESTLFVQARTRPGPTIEMPYSPPASKEKITSYGATFQHVAKPSATIVGTVRDKDTGKPLAGVTVQAHKLAGNPAPNYMVSFIKTTTDDRGRYRLTGMPIGKGSELLAVPPKGQPYLMSKKAVDTAAQKDGEPVSLDFELKRGVLVHGRVTDAKTGEPVPCCAVDYAARRSNANWRLAPGLEGAYKSFSYETDADGQYVIPVLPGRGIIIFGVFGKGEERYPVCEWEEFLDGSPVPELSPRCHAIVNIDPAVGADEVRLNAQLDPRQMLTGTVVDPDGKPLAGCHYNGLSLRDTWRDLSSATFQVNCYEPNHPRTICFVHLEKKLAGSLTAQGECKEPLTVRLQPWGVLTGRIVDVDGRPMGKLQIYGDNLPFYLLVKSPDGDARRVNRSFSTDHDGRFRVDGLAPGIKYKLRGVDQRTGDFFKLISDVTVESGQTKDLGNVTAKKPPPRRAASKAGSNSGGASTNQSKPTEHNAIEGIATDASGKPLAGVEIRCAVALVREAAVTDASGRFRFDLPENFRPSVALPLLARSKDMSLIGFAAAGPVNIAGVASKAIENVPTHIVLTPAKTVRVNVTTSDGRPAAGVQVEALGTIAFPGSTTNAAGEATIPFDPKAAIQWIIAWKDDAGFDYFENVGSWPTAHPDSPPETVSLRLQAARRVRVRTIDSAGRPMAGVLVAPWILKSPGKMTVVNFAKSLLAGALSDQSGACEFSWLPAESGGAIGFSVAAAGYHCPDQPHFDPEQPQQPVTFRLLKNAEITGTVRFPDGKPAAGIRILGEGRGATYHYFQGGTSSAADGTYRLSIYPYLSTIVGVADRDWAAASHKAIELGEGETRRNVDFALSRGTRIHGKVTVGPERKPARGHVEITELGDELGLGARKLAWQRSRLVRWAPVDENGEYQIRVGPGEYKVWLPNTNLKRDEISVKVADQSELIYNGTAALPALMRITGRIVNAADGKPVGGTTIYGQTVGPSSYAGFEARADLNGQFAVDRVSDTEEYRFYARNPDKGLAGITVVPCSKSDVTIDLRPAATVVGRVYQSDGKPAEGRKVVAIIGYGTNVRTVTGVDGAYRIPGLAVGSRCDLLIELGVATTAGPRISVELDRPGEIQARDMVLPRGKATSAAPAAAVEPTGRAAQPQGPAKPAETVDAASKTGRMQVRVVDETGKPLAGTKLASKFLGHESNYTTDADGQATVMVPGPNRLFLSLIAYPDGYPPMRKWWKNDSGNELIPDAFTFTFERGRTIGGVVRDEQGKPIQGAKIHLSISSEKLEQSQMCLALWDAPLLTDADGRWHLDHVPQKIDSMGIGQEHPDYISNAGGTQISAQEQRQIEERTAVIVMKKGIPLTGTVTGSEGKPIAGATVLLGEWWSPKRPAAMTDRQGHYRFASLAPGDTILTVVKPGLAPSLANVNVQRETKPADFRLERGNRLRVRVVGKDGKPIAGVFVTPDTWRGRRVLCDLPIRGRTDAEGRWAWTWAPKDVVKTDFGLTGYVNYMSIRGLELAPQEAEHVVTLYPALTISGHVVDAVTKQPIPRFRVIRGYRREGNKGDADWDRLELTGGKDGQYTAMFTQAVSANSSDYLVRIEADGYRPAISRAFKNSEGSVTYDFALNKGRTLEVTVRLADGKPAAGADVCLCPETAGKRINMAMFVKEGRFPYRGPFPFLTVGADGRLPIEPQDNGFLLIVVHDQGLAQTTSEALAAKPEITLQTWATINGVIRHGSRPAPNAKLDAYPMESNGERWSFLNFHEQTEADAEGKFVFPKLKPGKWNVRVLPTERNSGRATSQKQIELAPGRTVNLVLGDASGETSMERPAKGLPSDGNSNVAAPALRAKAIERRAVNKRVRDFPEELDLSTPESVAVARMRSSARKDMQTTIGLTWVKPDAEIAKDIEEVKNMPAERLQKALEVEIVEVRTYRDDYAVVIAKSDILPADRPYATHHYGRINGKWKSLDWEFTDEDLSASAEAAAERFDRERDALWQSFVKIRDQVRQGRTPVYRDTSRRSSGKVSKENQAMESSSNGGSRTTAPASLQISGIVRGPDGAAVAGAEVFVEVRDPSQQMNWFDPILQQPEAQAKLQSEPKPEFRIVTRARTDAEGRFTLKPQALPAAADTGHIIVLAKHYGLAMRTWDGKAAEMEIRLPAMAAVEGRLLTPDRNWASDVVVKVVRIAAGKDVDYLLDRHMAEKDLPPYWPRPVRSDFSGQITMEGVPAGCHLVLSLEHPSFAREEVLLDTGLGPTGLAEYLQIPLLPPKFTHELRPPRPVEGTVTATDTGKPLAGILVGVWPENMSDSRAIYTRTDADGHYRVSDRAGETYGVSVYPSPESGYLAEEMAGQRWPEGAKSFVQDLKLTRGVLFRGRVLDDITGKPIAGASVQYGPSQKNPRRSIPDPQSPYVSRMNYEFRNPAITDGDGRFVVTGLAGEGHLTVETPERVYVRKPLDVRYTPRAMPMGYTPVDVPPDGSSKEVTIRLVRGRTVTLQAVGPGRERLPSVIAAWEGRDNLHEEQWNHGDLFPEGKIVVRGLDPSRTTRVFMIDKEKKIGAAYDITAQTPEGPVEVRLQPNATVTGQAVGKDGEPATVHAYLLMCFDPEVARLIPEEPVIRYQFYANLTRGGGSTDHIPGGRFSLDNLVPGIPLAVVASGLGVGRTGTIISVEPLRPGEHRDLGRVVLGKREP